MHTVLLNLTSWLYKYNLRRSIVYKDGKTLFKRKAHRTVPPNASFTDGVATKDCSLDLTNRVSIRIFLPDHCLGTQLTSNNPKPFSWLPERSELFDGNFVISADSHNDELVDGASMDASPDYKKFEENEIKRAYYPNVQKKNKKLPVILQFHDGAFVNGSKDTQANDLFCRRIAKMCRSVVIAVGYRLAPEHKFPSARDDGIETLRWLARQANLAEFSSTDAIHSSVGLVDSFSYMLADPWVTAHVDYSRCVLLGVGAGGSIAEQVAREAASLSLELDPVKVMAQVLICPMFGGLALLPSEVLLADTYFLDRDTMLLLWKLVLPEGENRLDHPAVDPLLPSQIHLLRHMPSTLVVSAELDMLRDRAAAYVDALKRWHVDATLLNYRNAVHQFVTLEPLVDAKLAQACLEDIAIWFGKHVKQEWC